MDSLTRLQITNLFKKYDYFLTEYQFKNEISVVSHNLFQQNVERILNEYKPSNIIKPVSSDLDEEQPQDQKESFRTEPVEVDPVLKSLYRKIAKQTHPDKIINSYLNRLYIDATDAVELNDYLGIFRICVLLDIEFDAPQDIADKIEKEINNIKQKIAFLESSLHMKWHNSTRTEKNDILVNYLVSSLRLYEA